MKVRILESCTNWLVKAGEVYEVAQVTSYGVILKHPAPLVKPTLLKGEYEEVISFSEKELTEKCQENPWLKTFGVAFAEDPFMELDYQYCFTECKTVEELKAQFRQGNWAIRQGFTFQSLAFINQVNGGDEWWTLKKFEDGEIIAFESISFRHIIMKEKTWKGETFEQLIERLLKATKEQCRNLSY